MANNATAVSASTSAVTLLASKSRREGCSVYYDGAAILYLLVGEGTPSSSNYTVKMGDGYYTFWSPDADKFSGALKGIWSAAVGEALVTEYV